MAESPVSADGTDVDHYLSSHIQNDRYVSRMPSPPHLQLLRPFIPASLLLDNFKPPSGAPLLPLLRNMDLRSLFPRESVSSSWEYSLRYAAQAVLPYLYLGPRTVSKNLAFLREAKISMIIAIRYGDRAVQKPPPRMLKTAQETLGIELRMLDLKSSQDLISTFTDANEIINHHINMKNPAHLLPSAPTDIRGAVLVCCESGTDLSAAVAIAYLMRTFGLDLLRAHRLVQDQRFCISINQSTAHVLQSYEEILIATRDVSELSIENDQNDITLAQRDVKRTRDEDGDENMIEDAEEIDSTKRGSRNFSPFQD